MPVTMRCSPCGLSYAVSGGQAGWTGECFPGSRLHIPVGVAASAGGPGGLRPLGPSGAADEQGRAAPFAPQPAGSGSPGDAPPPPAGPDASGPRSARGWPDAQMPAVVQVFRILILLRCVMIVALLCLMLLTSLVAGLTGAVTGPNPLGWFVVLALLGYSPWAYRALGRGEPSFVWTIELTLFALGLIGFPIGTVVCGLLIYFWTRSETREWFGIT